MNATAGEPASTASTTATPVRRRLLIVEDSRISAMILRRTLDVWAAAQAVATNVRIAETIAEALEAVREFRPDAVLLDLVLGIECGEAVLHHIREHNLPIRVVVLSALDPVFPHDADRLDALAALRPDAVLPKPTPFAVVGAALFNPEAVAAQGGRS